jgi:hypothetical protein
MQRRALEIFPVFILIFGHFCIKPHIGPTGMTLIVGPTVEIRLCIVLLWSGVMD